MSLPPKTPVVTRYHFGVRLDELRAAQTATLPVELER